MHELSVKIQKCQQKSKIIKYSIYYIDEFSCDQIKATQVYESFISLIIINHFHYLST